jgi:propionyl-CoA synthetase
VGFWRGQLPRIPWFKKPTTILDDSRPPFMKWFPDGELNLSYCALDQHLNEPGKVALHHISPMTGRDVSVTYRELHS